MQSTDELLAAAGTVILQHEANDHVPVSAPLVSPLDEAIAKLPNHDNPATVLSGDYLQPTDPDTLEARLIDSFFPVVRDIGEVTETLLVPIEGQEIVDGREFFLTPLIAHDMDGQPRVTGRSTEIEGDGIPIDSPLEPYYRTTLGVRPELDSRFAIGLEYRSYVVAVASAGVDYDGNLFINQIQACLRRERGREGYERFMHESGLHHGFYWRGTLVRAWEIVAGQIGCPAVVIQSHVNSQYHRVRTDHGKKAYDDVAAGMFYDQQADKNWVKYL